MTSSSLPGEQVSSNRNIDLITPESLMRDREDTGGEVHLEPHSVLVFAAEQPSEHHPALEFDRSAALVLWDLYSYNLLRLYCARPPGFQSSPQHTSVRYSDA